MANMHIKYLGNLRCEAFHSASGNQITTDAPKDNNGKGEAFSPTDLLCTSLASCMITIMGITAQKKNILLQGVEAKINKVMVSDPRRVAEVQIELLITGNFNDRNRKILEKSALNCPVAKSLHTEVKQVVEFKYR